MFASIGTVQNGDTIKEVYLDGDNQLRVEKGEGVTVTKIEHNACSKRGTHVNLRECFDNSALVWVKRGALEVMVDWDIDNNVPVSDPRSPFNPNDDYSYPLGKITSIEETPDGLVAKGVTYNGDPKVAELLGEIFGSDGDLRTEVHLGELFPNAWDEHVATQQRLVAAEHVATQQHLVVNVIGAVDRDETGRQLKNYLRSQGGRRFGR